MGMLRTAALIMVLAVMEGFEIDLRQKILGSNAHVVVRTWDHTHFAGYEDMIESGWSPYVCGDPDHVVEVLKPFVEAGGNFFMGGFRCGPMPNEKVRKSMQLFMEKVAPRL